jgi:AAA domain
MKKTNIKTTDDFFAPLENTKPYFKAGFQGFAGSGKTYTAALVALGLHQMIGSKKPVVIFDTERASKFLKTLFANHKIEVLVRESRSMADLALTMSKLREEGISDVLIIDSISHVWEDFVESYKRRVNRQSLQFQDWGIIKPTWKKQFSDPFVTDPYHIIMTGRAGYEYDYERNEDTGKRELHKTGIKMKVEGETAYEPDMLVLMERYEEVLGREKRVWREATIGKDRSTVLDGKTIQNPKFSDFAPSVKVMLAGGKKAVTQAEADSAALFKTEEERAQWLREKRKALEEIEGYLVAVWPSTSAKDKQMKSEAVYQAFNTRSWTAVEELSPEELRIGYEKIVEFVQEIINGEKISNGKASGNSVQAIKEAA